jgi:hypothetical protein
MADEGCSPGLGRNPGARLHGRVMPHVLGVTALKVRDPVPFLVLMKTDDPLRDRRFGRVV